MRTQKTDLDSFKNRIKYRLKKRDPKYFALQESIFKDGYELFYDGREFVTVGRNMLANQIVLQKQLENYIRYNSYQFRLPF